MPVEPQSVTLAADPTPPATPTADDRAGMAWFNALSESERARWLAAAGSARPVDAWRAFQRARRDDWTSP